MAKNKKKNFFPWFRPFGPFGEKNISAI
jgi:hypothetical protein